MAKLNKNTNKNLTIEQKSKLNQPEFRRFDAYYGNLSEKDEEIYNKITELYKQVCDLGLTFYLGTVLPESNKSFANYRLTEVENYKDPGFLKKLNVMYWQMYYYLYCAGYIESLEKAGYIKIIKHIPKPGQEDPSMLSKKQVDNITNKK
jgi:hypothetical protein